MPQEYAGVKFAGQRGRATFALNTTGTPAVGDAVSLVAEGTVGLGTDLDPLFGVIERIDGDDFCTVVFGGDEAVTLNRTAAAIGHGQQSLAVDGAGLVKVVASKRVVQVIGDETVDSVDQVTVIL